MEPSIREGGLVAWQWAGYPRVHRDRRNLLLHLASAPLFVLGCVAVLAGAARGRPEVAGAGLLAMLLAFAAEGAGHRLEAEPPAPFRGPGDLLVRFFVEQWITFPRYVLSGGLGAAYRKR